MIFSYLKRYFIFFNVNEQLAVPFNELARGRSHVGHLPFVYTGLLVSAFQQSHKLIVTYCLTSSLLLAFCFLFVCVVDHTLMYPSSISPLSLI